MKQIGWSEAVIEADAQFTKNYSDKIDEILFDFLKLDITTQQEYIGYINSGDGQLFKFAIEKKIIDLVSLLVIRGVKLNNITLNKAPPLFIACREGNIPKIKLLLKNGADVNIQFQFKNITFNLLGYISNYPLDENICRSLEYIIRNTNINIAKIIRIDNDSVDKVQQSTIQYYNINNPLFNFFLYYKIELIDLILSKDIKDKKAYLTNIVDNDDNSFYEYQKSINNFFSYNFLNALIEARKSYLINSKDKEENYNKFIQWLNVSIKYFIIINLEKFQKYTHTDYTKENFPNIKALMEFLNNIKVHVERKFTNIEIIESDASLSTDLDKIACAIIDKSREILSIKKEIESLRSLHYLNGEISIINIELSHVVHAVPDLESSYNNVKTVTEALSSQAEKLFNLHQKMNSLVIELSAINDLTQVLNDKEAELINLYNEQEKIIEEIKEEYQISPEQLFNNDEDMQLAGEGD